MGYMDEGKSTAYFTNLEEAVMKEEEKLHPYGFKQANSSFSVCQLIKEAISTGPRKPPKITFNNSIPHALSRVCFPCYGCVQAGCVFQHCWNHKKMRK